MFISTIQASPVSLSCLTTYPTIPESVITLSQIYPWLSDAFFCILNNLVPCVTAVIILLLPVVGADLILRPSVQITFT